MRFFRIGFGIILSFVVVNGVAFAQTKPSTIDDYLVAAKTAAGLDWPGTFLRLCIPLPTGTRGAAPPAAAPRTPARETWYAEPAKVADNLYFLGTKIHNAWAIVGSD